LKNISSEIRSYKDEILEDVVRVVRIPSVREAALDGMPFGKGPAKALGYCLNLAKSMGLKVKNVDGYAGHIEYGEGEGLIGILAHCDVVPAGEGWTRPPFGGEVENDRIYGRGTMDDKGPAIAAIYCLKALSDLKIVPKRRIRVIIGASEECGMEDMEYYFAHEEMPDLAFSPDSEYPICNREKGILHIGFECAHDAKQILDFMSGNAANIVPVTAEATINKQDGKAFEDAAAALENDKWKYTVMDGKNGAALRCYGKSAHASVPEDGANAAAGLVKLLAHVYKKDAGALITFISEAIGLDYDGEKMGVACKDEPSGSLTLNLGVMNMDKNQDTAIIDIRYPVTFDGKSIYEKAAKKAALYGVSANLISDSAPLYVKEDSDLIAKLKHAYEIATGEEANLYSTGGGTYARVLKNRGVAFGAGTKPLAYYNIHGADEFLEIDDFMKHCEICLQAIYEIGC
jgi:succinyl-diaminopimelate desuccinylase